MLIKFDVKTELSVIWIFCAKTYFPICISTPILNRVQRYAFQTPDRVSEGKNVVHEQHNFEFK